VIGIVASQVVDTYHRPAVLIGINEGMGRGSARSIAGLNMYEILLTFRDLFLDFGGHEGAAGFAIRPDNIPELKRRLQRHVDEQVSPDSLVPRLEIDAPLEPEQVTLTLIKELERLAPFGEGNPEPVFLISNLELADFKKVGKDGKHFKAWFSRNGLRLETIGFGLGKIADKMDHQKLYDIAVNLESNEYNGFETAQLSLIDIREAGQ
jgi:single-stranded-DNA-specific exonuclease